MKFTVPTSTVRSISLFILISVRVKSACIEEDCTGQAIRVVNPSSGECITCFPCLTCPEGQTPSVRCPSTVPQGTHVQCVAVVPRPSVVSVSRATAYITNVMFTLVASPLPTSGHFSLSPTMQITSEVVSSHTLNHLSVVPRATSSKEYAGSNSLMTDDKPVLTPITEDDSRTGIYASCAATLIFVVLGIFYRIRKNRTVVFNHQTVSNHTLSNAMNTHSNSNSLHEVYLSPENSSAFVVLQNPAVTTKESTCQRSDNQRFSRNDQDLSEENAAMCIPVSLDVAHAEGDNMFENQTPFPQLQRHQSTSTTELYAVNRPCIIPVTSVPEDFQSNLLSRKVAKIPIKFYRKICIKLNNLRDCFWDDYRMVGEAIGLEKDEVAFLGQIGNPTEKMVQKFDSQYEGSIKKFRDIVKEMGRDDVVSIIDDWIVDEWKKSNSSSILEDNVL